MIPFLASAEVHIWSACFSENQANTDLFEDLLSDDEYQKAKSFKFRKDRDAFIISRGILRFLLGEYLIKDPQRIQILYGLWGKPCLSPEHSLCFNLSHSKEYILYAFMRSYEVGIDLEHVDPTLDVAMMAPIILSPQEQAHWREVPSKDKIHTFFKLWVYKEAFLKASGKGWLSNDQEIPLTILENIFKNSEGSMNKERASPYYFEAFPGYVSALHIESPFFYPLHYKWSVDGPQVGKAKRAQ